MTEQSKNRHTKDYIAIFDIGSNAVRFVVYDGLNRAPVKIHNERNICSLGADLGKTGALHPEGVARAIDSLKRFSGLVKAMKIGRVHAVATAAVRDAKDGTAFIDKIKNDFGLEIRLIDGDEEARLSALGVIANGLGRNGIIGDYGGGSLELIVVDQGMVRHKISLPLGSHRLHALQNQGARIKEIDAQLAKVDFLKDHTGLDFYALGGAWRSMARAHIHMRDYPLLLIDHYQIEGADATQFASLLARQKPETLEKTVGLSKKRLKDMSVAALTMERLFEKITPHRLIFSGTGLREGLVFDQLTADMRNEDGLIAGCKKYALKFGRFDDLSAYESLAQWMKPLFSGADEHFFRLLQASCFLSDIVGFDHEEYQAVRAFEQILVMPLYAVSHTGRAFLALSQYARYKGYIPRDNQDDKKNVTYPAQHILDDWTKNQAEITGLAQRLGYLLSGGALHLLEQTELKISGRKLTLSIDAQSGLLDDEIIGESLRDLSAKLGLEAEIQG